MKKQFVARNLKRKLPKTIDSRPNENLSVIEEMNVVSVSWKKVSGDLSPGTKQNLFTVLKIEDINKIREDENFDVDKFELPHVNNELSNEQKRAVKQFRKLIQREKKSQREKIRRLKLNSLLFEIGKILSIDSVNTDLLTLLVKTYDQLLQLERFKTSCTCQSKHK